jgi:hypothetical protein
MALTMDVSTIANLPQTFAKNAFAYSNEKAISEKALSDALIEAAKAHYANQQEAASTLNSQSIARQNQADAQTELQKRLNDIATQKNLGVLYGSQSQDALAKARESAANANLTNLKTPYDVKQAQYDALIKAAQAHYAYQQQAATTAQNQADAQTELQKRLNDIATQKNLGVLYGSQSQDALAKARESAANANLTSLKTPYDVKQAQYDALIKAAQAHYADQQQAASTAQNQADAQTELQKRLNDIATQKNLGVLYGSQSQEALGKAKESAATSNLTALKTPYDVQQAQLDVFKNSQLRNMMEAALAQHNKLIAPSPLAKLTGGMNFDPNAVNQNQDIPTNPAATPTISPSTQASVPGLPGTPSGELPSFIGPPDETAKEVAKQQALNKLKDWQTYNADLKKKSSTASGIKSTLNQLGQAYDAATFKGFPAGYSPAITSADQNTDRLANSVVQQLLGLDISGKYTNFLARLVQSTKINRGFNSEAFHQGLNDIKILADRLNEKQQFAKVAQSMGLDTDTSDILFNNYMNQNMVLDPSTGKINTKLLGNWKGYLSPGAIAAAKSGDTYVPITKAIKEMTPAQRKSWYENLSPAEQKFVKNKLSGTNGNTFKGDDE